MARREIQIWMIILAHNQLVDEAELEKYSIFTTILRLEGGLPLTQLGLRPGTAPSLRSLRNRMVA